MKLIQIPTSCPCCEYPLVTINSQLFCRNTACEAQIGKKLEHFAKVLGIKGFGPKTVEKLQLSDITELFFLDREVLVEAVGAKVADKLLDEIERAKNADLATVLASFSIPLIGETASKKIAKVTNDIDSITEETCKIAGLGAKATDNLLGWLSTDYQDLKEFLPFSFDTKPSKQIDTNAQTVCITGRLKSYKTKSEATIALEAAGYIVVDSVTKATNILVDETDKTSTKRTKAESLGITIITDLNDLLKEKTND